MTQKPWSQLHEEEGRVYVIDPANITELLKRWAAFEEGGAVAILDDLAGEWEKMTWGPYANPGTAVRRALAALVESGAGAGKEPQG